MEKADLDIHTKAGLGCLVATLFRLRLDSNQDANNTLYTLTKILRNTWVLLVIDLLRL